MMNQIELLFDYVFEQIDELREQVNHLHFVTFVNVITLIINMLILLSIYASLQ